MKRNLQPLTFFSKLFFFTVVVFGSLSSVAQTTNIAVAPNKMNVLYIGVDNPVSIAASAAADDKVTVTIDGGGGTITKQSAGNYIVRVTDVTENCSIQVNVDGKPAGTSRFRVRALPSPYGTVGGFKSGANVSADAFRQQVGLGLYIQDFPFDVKFEVVSFTITMDTHNKDIVEARCEGAKFSDAATALISEHLKPGTTVTIDNILAKDESGKQKKIPSLVYYIK
jgi:hypothetical protein